MTSARWLSRLPKPSGIHVKGDMNVHRILTDAKAAKKEVLSRAAHVAKCNHSSSRWGSHYPDFVMFTLFYSILGRGYLTQTFQPGWCNQTQHTHETLMLKSCVCRWWCLPASTVHLRWKLGRHHQWLSKWQRSPSSTWIQVGYRLHNTTNTNGFHVNFWGVSPLVGVGMFALQMIICVFNFAFSPSVGMLLLSLGSLRPIHI